jgi:phosphoserine phosphatase RsbU/P
MSKPEKNPVKEIMELKDRLAQRDAQLQIINSVQVGLLKHLDVQSIYDLVGDKIRDIFQAQVVMISTYDKKTQTIEHRYAIENGKRIYAPGNHPIKGFRIQVVESRAPVLVSTRVAEIAASLGQSTLPGTITPKTWLGVPMIVGDEVTGILSLQDIEKENAFDEPVVRLLQTLGASMSVALENARLWEQEKLYREGLEREFEIGRDIQTGFLPDEIPQVEGWEIQAYLESAREVAGDFYDVFKLSDQRIAVVIADVCDKGLGAALFMTLFRSLLRAGSNIQFYARTNENQRNSSSERLESAISLTNNYIAETHGKTGMFATVFFGILDLESSTLHYINCGHPSPLVIDKTGKQSILIPTGPALGVELDARHIIKTVRLNKGDLFFAFTDGLTEMVNKNEELFTIDQFIPLLNVEQPLSLTMKAIIKRMKANILEAKRLDDITLLALRCV